MSIHLHRMGVYDTASAAANNNAWAFVSSTDLSSDATADFTGFSSGTYDGYRFDFLNVVPATNSVTFYVRTSTDGGATYDSGTNNYTWRLVAVSDANGVSDSSSSATEIACGGTSSLTRVGSDAGEDGISGSIYIFAPQFTSYTRLYGNLTYFAGGNTDVEKLMSPNFVGMRESAADVDAIRFLFSSGNLESGTITMYGLKNA